MNTPDVLARRPPDVPEVHVIWMTTGLGCDGDSVSVTAASLPSIEDVVMGNIPGLPKVHLHNPVLAYEVGDDFMDYWFKAAAGKLEPFVLVLEGSVPNERIKKEGYWAAMGTDPDTAQPITTNEWIDRLAPKALAVIACGTCATYGGIHAMEGNPTGAMGLADYLGWVAGLAPVIPLDDQLRPKWLFETTVHDGCDRAGYYEEGDFATEYGSPKCIVKLGCWGPVVNCNVTKRGWMDGLGGCPNVGGICIGCTMPGFPDKFMPFMDEPPGAKISSGTSTFLGKIVRSLRAITNRTVNKEPQWRHRRAELTTGYSPKHYAKN